MEENTTNENQDPALEENTNEEQTYPAHVVKELREENAKFRTRARDSSSALEDSNRRLFSALVKLDGRLADPDGFEYDADLLEGTALEDRITAVLEKNPRLGSRAVSGDVGQGASRNESFDLIDYIRSL